MFGQRFRELGLSFLDTIMECSIISGEINKNLTTPLQQASNTRQDIFPSVVLHVIASTSHSRSKYEEKASMRSLNTAAPVSLVQGKAWRPVSVLLFTLGETASRCALDIQIQS